MREILFRGQTLRYGEKVRMGDGELKPQFTEQNYGTKWVAYRRKPEEVSYGHS